MGPILGETTNILDFTVQVKLKKVFLGFNLAESSIPDGITRLGEPIGPLTFKGDVKIDNNPVRSMQFITTVIGLKSQIPNNIQIRKSNDQNILLTCLLFDSRSACFEF